MASVAAVLDPCHTGSVARVAAAAAEASAAGPGTAAPAAAHAAGAAAPSRATLGSRSLLVTALRAPGSTPGVATHEPATLALAGPAAATDMHVLEPCRWATSALPSLVLPLQLQSWG